ncbi:hypothetical protein BRPE64_BCDS11140 [Caballeronia insecticola]|uniref:Uncharacterized protein n=1 Tax=Caballeronia insecticola TaxID=758793 RepID=R4WXB2_9BURK|nr:hypothetical protein BRPE64_BCDS11140 [Caballeronia insecticola]
MLWKYREGEAGHEDKGPFTPARRPLELRPGKSAIIPQRLRAGFAAEVRA